MQEPKSLREQIANWCRHFNGILHDVCDAGISYDAVRGPQGLPCIKSHGCAERCASAAFKTPEEVEEEAQQKEQVASAFLKELLAGKTCPHCHAPIKEKKQFGRSIYVLPCWHRLGTGKLSQKGKNDE